MFHGKKHPNYPTTITLEGGAFYLESILIEKRNWSLREMRQSVTSTHGEIKFEGLTFRAGIVEMRKWCDSYKKQVGARSKARAEETALLEAHATSTNKESSGVSLTPEVATGGKGGFDDRSETAVSAPTTTVDWGALTPERVCKEVEDCGHLEVDVCPVNTMMRGCSTLQDSFINRQLSRSIPITLGRIRRRRRRRRAKAAATNIAAAAVTPEAVSAEAEAEPMLLRRQRQWRLSRRRRKPTRQRRQ